MGRFDLFNTPAGPYKEQATNLIYDLLFCDNLDLYKKNSQHPDLHPWNILFAESAEIKELEQIIHDPQLESRSKLLAFRKLKASGGVVEQKELLAVIVEVGLEEGLDVLASYRDGTARYINYTGSMIIWETADANSITLTNDLFEHSQRIVNQIGPWDKPRRPFPTKGNLRISFLASDGLYFGEGPVNVLFNDPFSGPALQSATALMQYLTQKVVPPRT